MKCARKNMFVRSALTITEMVVAMVIIAIVFAALLPQFRAIENSWAAKSSTAETIQNGRIISAHFNENLAKAARVIAVSDQAATLGFIEFEDSQANTYRYDSAGGMVRFGAPASLDDLAGPVTQFRFTCYDACDLTTPITDDSLIRYVKLETTLADSKMSSRNKTFKASAYLKTNAITFGNPTTPYEPGVSMDKEIDYSGSNAVIDSYNSTQGAYGTSNNSSNAVITVNGKKKDNITLSDNAIVKGDAYIGPGSNINESIVLSSGAQITGTKGTLDEKIDMPNFSRPFGGSHEGIYKLSGSSTQTINSDHYFDKLELRNSSTLKIDGNVTMLVRKKMTVDADAKLEILPNSTLDLYLRDNAEISGTLNMTTGNPDNLRIYMIKNKKTFSMFDSATVYAVLQNPKGNIWTSANSQFFGKMKGEELQGSGAIHIDLNSIIDTGSQLTMIYP